MMYDRIAIREGRKQLYGTQLQYDPVLEKYEVYPLADPKNVNKYRQEKEINATLEAYLNMIGEIYGCKVKEEYDTE